MQEASCGEIIYSRPIALPGTELLLAKRDANYWRVFHERYVICTCSNGAASGRYRGKTQFLSNRGHALIEPGETHITTAIHKPVDHKVLQIAPTIVEDASREMGLVGTPHFRVDQIPDNAFYFALEQFYDAVLGEATALEQQSRFTVCLHLLLERHTERTPPAHGTVNSCRAIERAKDYLQSRFNESVTLDELSAATGLSRFYLLRIFAKHVGLPPHAYQIHIRIERASALLRAGVPPSNAALLVGFADQSHFTRHFKRICYTTPSKYALG